MAEPIHPTIIRKMISYYYLVSCCPPQHIDELNQVSLKMRTRLAKSAGIALDELSERVIPEIARRILIFHLSDREPDPELVEVVTEILIIAENGPEETAAFQDVMRLVSAHPNRAKLENRLHRKKGCAFCSTPCRFGFFTLISEPDFITLKSMLDAENRKLAQERDAVTVLWTYTRKHIWSILETEGGMINARSLSDLSYCLLLLGTAKSRFALIEDQLKGYLELSNKKVQMLQDAPLRLVD